MTQGGDQSLISPGWRDEPLRCLVVMVATVLAPMLLVCRPQVGHRNPPMPLMDLMRILLGKEVSGFLHLLLFVQLL